MFSVFGRIGQKRCWNFLQALCCNALSGVKGFEHKKCPFCGSKQVKKNGRQNGKQCYKYHSCGRQFDGGKRLDPQKIRQVYTTGKQTAAQLAAAYGCSSKTVYRHLKKAAPKAQFAAPPTANVIMDITCFGRRFGIMVLFDSISKRALSVTEVKHETNALYVQAIGCLKAKGVKIQSIICDGRKGIPQTFPDIPVQLCHFHQVQTVRRYLTRNPKTEAGKALWQLALTLKTGSRADFESKLKAWFERHRDFFNERTKNPETGKSHYTHPRLRSAYSSLKRNLDNLFVFEKHPELGIPNTTNLLDGTFSDMKRLLACHHGMSRDNKIRFIKDYFSISDV